MSYKSLCVIVTDAALDGPALSAAVAMAEREDAHLDVFCLGVDPARYEAMPMGATAVLLDSGIAEAREHAEALVTWANSKLPTASARRIVQPVVVSQLGLDAMVARLCRYADLVVATRPYGPGRKPIQVSVTEAALFGSGAPVLIVPDVAANGAANDPLLAGALRRIVVAWDESEEALSAIRKAVPLLKKANHVDIVLVDPPVHSPERSDPGGGLCMMLSRHGVRAEVSILSRTLPRVSDVLLRFVREHGADAVVMGAYGHSRFREAIIGGATREMLESAELPLVMAH
jgi:nucleotide-binding universal stress UspA family protein